MTAVRALAFGDLEGACWGAAWVPEGALPILALGAGSAAQARPASLTAQPDTGDWHLEAGDGRHLRQEHRPELSGTDQRRLDRAALLPACLEKVRQVHTVISLIG